MILSKPKFPRVKTGVANGDKSKLKPKKVVPRLPEVLETLPSLAVPSGTYGRFQLARLGLKPAQLRKLQEVGALVAEGEEPGVRYRFESAGLSGIYFAARPIRRHPPVRR